MMWNVVVLKERRKAVVGRGSEQYFWKNRQIPIVVKDQN